MELYIEPSFTITKRNPVTGCFMPGHIPYNKGKKMSGEKREKIKHTWFPKGHGNTNKNKHKGGKKPKPVEMLTKNGRFIRNFPSIAEAERQTNIHNIKLVMAGKRKSAGGFKWNELTNNK